MKRFFQLSKLMMLLWVTALFAVSCDTDDGSDDKADELLGWYTDMLLTSESWFFDFSGLDMSSSSFSIFDEEGRLAPTDGYMSTYIPNINFIKVIDDHTLVAYEYGDVYKAGKSVGEKVYDLNGNTLTGPMAVYASAPYYIVYERDGNYLIFNDAEGHEVKMGISDNALIFDGKRYEKIASDYKDPYKEDQPQIDAITGNWYRHLTSGSSEIYCMITFNRDGTGRYVEYDKPYNEKLRITDDSFTHAYKDGKLTFTWGENKTETADATIYKDKYLIFTDWPDRGTNTFSLLTDEIQSRIEDFRETAAQYKNATLTGLHNKPLGIYNLDMKTASVESIAQSIERDYNVSYSVWGSGGVFSLCRDSNNVCINVKYHDMYFNYFMILVGDPYYRYFNYDFDIDKTKLPDITATKNAILNDYRNMGIILQEDVENEFYYEYNGQTYSVTIFDEVSKWRVSIGRYITLTSSE